MHKIINNLLVKEVSRKEFLTLLSAGALSILGVSAMLKGIDQTFGGNKATSRLNYGDEPYGGSQQPKNGMIHG